MNAVMGNYRHRELFFVWVFIGLLIFFLVIGEGPTTAAVLLVPLGILLLYCIAFRILIPRRAFPNHIMVSFFCFLIYIVGTSFWSDDIGRTITASMTCVNAFLFYYLFYRYSSEHVVKHLSMGLVVLPFIIAGSFAVVTHYSVVTVYIPIKNMIEFQSGHHPAIILLLFAYPVVTWYWFTTKRCFAFFLWLLVVGMSLATFSRAGVCIELLYTLSILVLRKYQRFRLREWIGIGIIAATTVALAVFPYQSFTKTAPWLPKHAKEAIPIIYRGEYWKQSIMAIKERPLFGSGFGTFQLESKRLEERVFTNSSSAHNSLLHIVVELGIVGGILCVYLLYRVLRNVFIQWNHHALSTPMRGMVGSIGCCIFFSFIDIPFSYSIVILIFWALVGCVHGMLSSKQMNSPCTNATHTVGIVTCIAISVVFGSIFMFPRAFPLVHALLWEYPMSIVLPTYPPRDRERILLLGEQFHKKNSAILLSLATEYEKEGRLDKAEQLYQEAATLNPFTGVGYHTYFRFLAMHKNYEKLGRELQRLSIRTLPTTLHDQVYSLELDHSQWFDAYQAVFSSPRIQGYAAIYYLLGIHSLERNPQQTEQLWKLARDSFPDYGHLQIEYASLYYYLFQDPEQSRELLIACQTIPSPAMECVNAIQHGLLKPGELKHYIEMWK